MKRNIAGFLALLLLCMFICPAVLAVEVIEGEPVAGQVFKIAKNTYQVVDFGKTLLDLDVEALSEVLDKAWGYTGKGLSLGQTTYACWKDLQNNDVEAFWKDAIEGYGGVVKDIAMEMIVKAEEKAALQGAFTIKVMPGLFSTISGVMAAVDITQMVGDYIGMKIHGDAVMTYFRNYCHYMRVYNGNQEEVKNTLCALPFTRLAMDAIAQQILKLDPDKVPVSERDRQAEEYIHQKYLEMLKENEFRIRQLNAQVTAMQKFIRNRIAKRLEIIIPFVENEIAKKLPYIMKYNPEKAKEIRRELSIGMIDSPYPNGTGVVYSILMPQYQEEEKKLREKMQAYENEVKNARMSTVLAVEKLINPSRVGETEISKVKKEGSIDFVKAKALIEPTFEDINTGKLAGFYIAFLNQAFKEKLDKPLELKGEEFRGIFLKGLKEFKFSAYQILKDAFYMAKDYAKAKRYTLKYSTVTFKWRQVTKTIYVSVLYLKLYGTREQYEMVKHMRDEEEVPITVTVQEGYRCGWEDSILIYYPFGSRDELRDEETYRRKRDEVYRARRDRPDCVNIFEDKVEENLVSIEEAKNKIFYPVVQQYIALLEQFKQKYKKNATISTVMKKSIDEWKEKYANRVNTNFEKFFVHGSPISKLKDYAMQGIPGEGIGKIVYRNIVSGGINAEDLSKAVEKTVFAVAEEDGKDGVLKMLDNIQPVVDAKIAEIGELPSRNETVQNIANLDKIINDLSVLVGPSYARTAKRPDGSIVVVGEYTNEAGKQEYFSTSSGKGGEAEAKDEAEITNIVFGEASSSQGGVFEFSFGDVSKDIQDLYKKTYKDKEEIQEISYRATALENLKQNYQAIGREFKNAGNKVIMMYANQTDVLEKYRKWLKEKFPVLIDVNKKIKELLDSKAGIEQFKEPVAKRKEIENSYKQLIEQNSRYMPAKGELGRIIEELGMRQFFTITDALQYRVSDFQKDIEERYLNPLNIPGVSETTGVISGEEAARRVRSVLDALINAYQNENVSQFMSNVDENFSVTGSSSKNYTVLQQSISDDFRLLSDIRFTTYIKSSPEYYPVSGLCNVKISWFRRAFIELTGHEWVVENKETTFVFKFNPEGKPLLYRTEGANMFGLADPFGRIYITEGKIDGKEITEDMNVTIEDGRVYQNGTAIPPEGVPGEGNAAGVVTGSATIFDAGDPPAGINGWDFSANAGHGGLAGPGVADIFYGTVGGYYLWLGPGHTPIKKLGTSWQSTVPTAGYNISEDILVGDVCAIKTQEGKYAQIKIKSFNGTQCQFDFKFQTNGTPNF